MSAACLSFLLQQSLAQEVRSAPATTFAKLPASVVSVDKSYKEPRPPAVKPDFQIESTQVKLVDVVESPPMFGLPSVEGTIRLKVHSVADPGLPEPERAFSARFPQPDFSDNPEFLERLAQLEKEQEQNLFVSVSATVFDRNRTRLTCRPLGDGNSHSPAIAWSNIDFNDFRGFGSFKAVGVGGEKRSYQLMMFVGNEDTEQRRAWAAAHRIKWDKPEIPILTKGAPAFIIVSQDPDPASVKLIEDLHALYRDQGKEMAEIAVAREKAYQEKKAYLLANPPKPKDVTVHFWKRENATAVRAK